mmetsp:Transcript_9017/g.20016  ORF Transcript_9017/g.20016 Transcript_9017/m.20016 type:complete len:269 (+) Transcript_9017:147-953(+)
MLKDWGEDPQGGKLYSRYERTRVERLYTEAIDKELQLREEAREAAGGRAPQFAMNLANAQRLGSLLDIKYGHCRMEIIADKVEKVSPQERMSAAGHDPKSFEVNAMKHNSKVPGHKWDLPCTKAHEVGWLLAKPATLASIQARNRQKNYAHTTRNDEALAFSAKLKSLKSSSSSSPSSPSKRDKANNNNNSNSNSNSTQPLHLHGSTSLPSLSTMGYSEALPRGDFQKLKQINSRKFYKPLNFCPITKYADIYVSLMHEDPFYQNRGK